MDTSTIDRNSLNRRDLPLMLRCAEIIYEANVPLAVHMSKDVRWQTHTDSGKDVHIDHHFDDE